MAPLLKVELVLEYILHIISGYICFTVSFFLESVNSVYIVWVPGHSLISRDELADELTRI